MKLSIMNYNKKSLLSGLELELRGDILNMLRYFTGDYAKILAKELIDDITLDVVKCSDFENGIWSEGDIALAIGRVLCKRLQIEIN